MTSLDLFKALVVKHCGLQLEGVAEARLSKAIKTLSAETGLTHAPALIEKLKQDSAAFDSFVSHLTVNETYFFREPKAINWLVNTYLPQRLAEKGAPLAILSAGCSSGEEPYSLAMALFERYGERATRLFTLVGGDVDRQVLAKARQGVYSGMAFRALPPALKQRFFSRHQTHYKISEQLRNWVTFQPFNLLEPNSVHFHATFDVILFRNVSIYFNEPTRRRIQQHLQRLLAPQGILLCGVTETLGNDLGVFRLVETQGVFYFHSSTKPVLPKSGISTPITPTSSKSTSTKSTHIKPAFVTSASVPLAQCFDTAQETIACAADPESSVLLPPTPKQERLAAHEPSFDQRLQSAHQLLNQNAFEDAARLLETLLGKQPWSVDALLLAGLVARWQKMPEQAYGLFKRAIYVAPDCWPAHFYKAELFRQSELADDPVQRQQGYSAVVRLLDEAPISNGGLQTISSPLPPGDARFLAKRYLNMMLATPGVG